MQIQDLQICWVTGTRIIFPEGNNSTKFYVLFVIGAIWKEKLVFNWRVLNSCCFFSIYLHLNNLIGFRWHFKNLQICWFTGIKILLSERNDGKKFESLFHVGFFSEYFWKIVNFIMKLLEMTLSWQSFFCSMLHHGFPVCRLNRSFFFLN